MNNTTHPTTEQSARALDLLIDFANQRPGFDLADYGGGRDGYKYYRQDYRQALSALHEFRQWLNIALRRHERAELSALIADYLHRSNDRLTFSDCDPLKLQYITGQYYPTEYRWAAVRVLRSIVWHDIAREYSTGEEVRKALKRYGATRSMID
jgi:hypothetical protein